MTTTTFDARVLALDCTHEVARIATHIVNALRQFHKRGVVLGLSGGVDSSVCAALAVKALGPKKVFGLLMPERDSSSSSEDLGRTVAEQLGISYLLENIGPTVEAIGCYRWRDEAMRTVFPDYAESWKSKIAIAGGAQGHINHFKLIVQSPDGQLHEARLPLHAYLQIVAATNYKQRIRKTVEYFHADRLNYAVIGTPNLLEYDQGFFVKNGDGAADIKPIAHLYKTQVYALARYLGLPDAVCNATPTTDTYSLAQGQDEFYFALPYGQMDLALWACNHALPAAELAQALGVSVADAEFIYVDIEAKRRTARYLHATPALLEDAAPLAAAPSALSPADQVQLGARGCQQFSDRLRRLTSALSTLPDKPEENAQSALRALWHAAGGQPLSVERAGAQTLSTLDDGQIAQLDTLIARRVDGVPLAHLTGLQQFMGLDLLAGPQALIPRAETALLGQAALAKVREAADASGQAMVIDVCTGSGNLAVALAHAEPRAQVQAADLSDEAVALAQRNVDHLGLGQRVQVRCGDFLSPFDSAAFHGQVDVLVCNPPYISSGKVKAMPDEIASHEPHLAFDGGPFGVRILQRLMREAPAFLRPGGWLAFEVGLGQGPAVLQWLAKMPEFARVETQADAQGQIRVVLALRAPS